MKKFFCALLVLTPTLLNCQVPKGEFALGASLGTRIAIEARVGSHQFIDGRHEKGYDLLFSMWFAPLGSEDPVLVNEGQIDNTWSRLNLWERISGIGIGGRFFPSFWGVGVCLDLLYVERFQRWVMGDRLSRVDIRQNAITKFGISADLAFRFSARWTADCWIGNRRGFLLGATYSL